MEVIHIPDDPPVQQARDALELARPMLGMRPMLVVSDFDGTLALPLGWDTSDALGMVAVNGGDLTMLEPVASPTVTNCGAASRSIFMDDVIWVLGWGGMSAVTLEEPRSIVADVSYDQGCGGDTWE